MSFSVLERNFLFNVSGEHEFSRSHAQVPFIVEQQEYLRVFFATRDANGKTRPSFYDLDKNTHDVVYKHDIPLMELGARGSFDEDGVMPSCFIQKSDKLYMYYTGWNSSDSVAYRLAIGVAVSTDNGCTFTRCFDGPILDRNSQDLVWVGQPHVILEDHVYKMWYLSCDQIRDINQRPEPLYRVKYAESSDGINWCRRGEVSIDYNLQDTHAIGRPCVFKHGGEYFMLHSNRQADAYRTEASAGYRLVLSKSKDGKKWQTLVDPLLSKPNSGWDSIMNEYACVHPVNDTKFLVLHNGNGFGAEGIGRFLLELHD